MDNFFNANDDLIALILSFLGRTDYYNARRSIPGIARLIERTNIPPPFPEMDMFTIGREGRGGFEFQSPVWSPTGDSITCHMRDGIYNFHLVNGTARYSHWYPDPPRANTNFQSLLFTENGSLMVTVDFRWGYSVRVWDNRNPTNRQLLMELEIGEVHVLPRVAISPDGTRLFSLTNTELYIHDTTNILTADAVNVREYNHDVSLQTDTMLLHPNGTIIIYNFDSSGRSGISVTSMASGTTFTDTQQELIVDMALASDGSMFALAHINGSVSLWTIDIVDDESVTNAYYDESDTIVECINTNIFSSEELYTPRYTPNIRPLYAVSFSHDDRYIIAGDSRRADTSPGCKLRFYNIANGETRSEHTGTFDNVNAICPSPDGTRLVFRSGLTMYFTTVPAIVNPFG